MGARLLGLKYGELDDTLGVAIKLGTTRQLKSATAAYPTITIGSVLGSML